MELKSGENKTFLPPDPDGFREWIQKNKNLKKEEKLTDLSSAIKKFVKDGDYIKLGGFGQVRVSMAAIYEIIKQKKRNLTIAGHTTSHDLDLLLAGGCVSQVEVAYSFAHELRPIRSKVGLRLLKEGKLKISEWTNASFAWRLKAGALGISFIPARFMLGTDTFTKSGAKEIICPFTNQKYLALPALNPDVAIIHVNRADIYGNAEIDGMIVSDDDAASASKRVIITTEEIVSSEQFELHPERVVIPFYCTDAVVHVPYGSYPCEMPGYYWFDEEHLAYYIKATHDEKKLEQYLNEFYFNTKDWSNFIEKWGGEEKLNFLRRISEGKESPHPIEKIWGED